jgi:predicted RNase H-like nuclease (RuvC/YqgF family)|tara:strand:+ start:927 stop:1067 length:141 start_codon:yes stop_codon:yes gene_type:complete
MNVYSPTGKKIENWPLWVKRLSEENQELRRKVMELEKQLMEEISKT